MVIEKSDSNDIQDVISNSQSTLNDEAGRKSRKLKTRQTQSGTPGVKLSMRLIKEQRVTAKRLSKPRKAEYDEEEISAKTRPHTTQIHSLDKEQSSKESSNLTIASSTNVEGVNSEDGDSDEEDCSKLTIFGIKLTSFDKPKQIAMKQLAQDNWKYPVPNPMVWK